MQAIPEDLDHPFSQRCSFPREWRGLSGDTLATVSSIPGALYCHENGFFARARYLESALLMARTAAVFGGSPDR